MSIGMVWPDIIVAGSHIMDVFCTIGTTLRLHDVSYEQICFAPAAILLHSNQNQYNNYVSNEYRFLILLMMAMGP